MILKNIYEKVNSKNSIVFASIQVLEQKRM